MNARPVKSTTPLTPTPKQTADGPSAPPWPLAAGPSAPSAWPVAPGPAWPRVAPAPWPRVAPGPWPRGRGLRTSSAWVAT